MEIRKQKKVFQVEVFWFVTPCGLHLGPLSGTSPWRRRQQGLSKRWYPTATLHSVTAQKTSNSSPPGKIQISQKKVCVWKDNRGSV